MLPAHARILTCPHCGQEKEVLSLKSGNTFHARQWSDAKMVAPMLPRVSFVQKCPKCGHYYLLTNQDYRHGKGYSSNTGEISYEELKEAIKELTLTPEEEAQVRLMLVWGYNDSFARVRNKSKPQEYDYFCDNVHKLLALQPAFDQTLIAELHREIGKFEQCLEILQTIKPENDYITHIIAEMRSRAERRNAEVWEITHNNS